MNRRADLRAEPWRFDFFTVMREFERGVRKKPRFGESSVVAEELLELVQDPFLEFPATNIAGYEERPNGRSRLKTRFLGYFGPQGPLPLNTTVDAYLWMNDRDRSFADFTNILAGRFIQLFYRAWADSRPIVQYDRPNEDRFFAYVASVAGVGTSAGRNRDAIDDIAKVAFAGLTGGQVKSAARLLRLIRGVFRVEADVEERIGSWLTFEPGDALTLGEAGCTLGTDSFLGQRAYSINEKIRIRIDAGNLEQYRRFLPSGALSEPLTDLVFHYLGHRYEFDVELSLPAREAPPARLGQSGELGWTAWLAPPADGGDRRLRDARFDPMERRRKQDAERRAKAKEGKGKRQ